MSHRTRRKLQWALGRRPLALALVVLAVPGAGSAVAQEPVEVDPCIPPSRYAPPPLVQPRAACDGGDSQQSSTFGKHELRTAATIGAERARSTEDGGGADAGVVAGGAALLAVITAGGVLVAIRRRGARTPPPATQH